MAIILLLIILNILLIIFDGDGNHDGCLQSASDLQEWVGKIVFNCLFTGLAEIEVLANPAFVSVSNYRCNIAAIAANSVVHVVEIVNALLAVFLAFF